MAAHTESPEGVKVALENGVDSIEHGAKMDEETIRLYKERVLSSAPPSPRRCPLCTV